MVTHSRRDKMDAVLKRTNACDAVVSFFLLFSFVYCMSRFTFALICCSAHRGYHSSSKTYAYGNTVPHRQCTRWSCTVGISRPDKRHVRLTIRAMNECLQTRWALFERRDTGTTLRMGLVQVTISTALWREPCLPTRDPVKDRQSG